MKVSLLDYTGKGMPDAADYAARLLIYMKSTRLTQGEELQKTIDHMSSANMEYQLHEVAMSIHSSWEFLWYMFQITGITRACSLQISRSRYSSIAQQAQRVADMSDFETLIPETISSNGKSDVWEKVISTIRWGYQTFRSNGIPAQDARGILPNNALTNLAWGMNLNALAAMAAKRDNLRAQGEYANVVREMKMRVIEVHPWTKPFLEPERTKTPALDQLLKEQLAGRSPVDAPEINSALKELDMLKGTWG